jgi:hypothetical protein
VKRTAKLVISTFREFSKRGSSVRDEDEPVLDQAARSFFQDSFFSNLSIIRQQSPPESVYANFLKGMRIHRDGSLAHAIGESPLPLGVALKVSIDPTNSLSGIGHIVRMAQILFQWLDSGPLARNGCHEHGSRARNRFILLPSSFRRGGSYPSQGDHGSRATGSHFIPYPFAFIFFKGETRALLFFVFPP